VLSGDPAFVLPGRPRSLFRWGVLDVLEHCPDEHACETCPLHPECQGRAKTVFTPLTAGHITIDDAVAMKSRVGRETWESEMLCLRPSRSDTVYPEFSSAIHVFDDEKEVRRAEAAARAVARKRAEPAAPIGTSNSVFSSMIAGIDFAHRAESVVLLAGVTPSGVVVVLREHCRKGQVIDDQIQAINRWIEEGLCARPGDLSDAPALEWIGIDPAGRHPSPVDGETCALHLIKAGFKCRSRGSAIALGVRMIQGRIAPAWRGPGHSDQDAPPRLLVHRSCTRLIECLTRYRYDEKDPESLTPMKDGHDHAPDALRYMILNLEAPHRTQMGEYA
jgi:hypothetical protein